MSQAPVTLQALIDRARLWLAGVQYSGKRQMYELFGYRRFPVHMDYVGKYLREPIAKRIIDAPVNATWVDPPVFDDDAPFMEAWEELLSEVPVWHNIIRLDKLAGLGRFAIMVIGFNDGKRLSDPVTPPENGEPLKVIYLQPYAEYATIITQFDQDVTSPRYGYPMMYSVNPGLFNLGGQSAIQMGGVNIIQQSLLKNKFTVHYSRVLHVAENLLEDRVFGRSRMEVAFNTLDDILKVSGGAAELFWLTANRGLQINLDKDMDLDPEDEANMVQMVDDYVHQLKRVLRTRGTEVKELGTQTADPTGVFNMLVTLLSIATGIPKMILTGSTLGQLASQQDRSNWAERIQERVTDYGEPVVFFPFLRTLINASVLPQPQNLTISWPEAFKLSPLERGQTSAQMARSAANMTKAFSQLPNQEDAAPLFSPEEARNIVGFGKHMPMFEQKGPQGKRLGTPDMPTGTNLNPAGKDERFTDKVRSPQDTNQPFGDPSVGQFNTFRGQQSSPFKVYEKHPVRLGGLTIARRKRAMLTST